METMEHTQASGNSHIFRFKTTCERVLGASYRLCSDPVVIVVVDFHG